jgi:(R,R)-butanediol dehydrogenase / meso-butanediol dehydrogenase / diacetyl reductase
MLAVRLHDLGDLRVEEIDEPGTPGPSQVRLRNLRAGICGTDLHEFRHGPLLATRTPHPLTGTAIPQVLGHEFSAEVLAVGEAVTTVNRGDRVAIMPLFFCGRCVACTAGRPQSCERLGAVGLNWAWGGMAEFSIVHEHQVAPLPDSMTDLQGAMVEPTAVAIHSVRTAGVKPGDVVLVTGAGPIGQLVALVAMAAGAAAVFLSEPNSHRRERARVLGLDGLFDPAEVDVPSRLREITQGGVDVAIECAGHARAVNTCLASLHPGGVMMQTGLHTAAAAIDMRMVTLRDLVVRGANCFPVDSWPRAISLIASGKVPAERVVTAEVPLADAIAGGFESLLDPGSDQIKIVLDPAGASS